MVTAPDHGIGQLLGGVRESGGILKVVMQAMSVLLTAVRNVTDPSKTSH